MNEQATTRPTLEQSPRRRFLGGCLRLLLFALTIAAVTAAIYYVTPYIYRYVVTPVQNNQLAIAQLRQAQARLQDDVEGRLTDQRQRITQLETDLAAERETRSELENRLTQQEEISSAQAVTQAELEARLEAQEQAVAALEQSLDDLDAAMAEVERSMAIPEVEVAKLQRRTLLLQMQQATLKARLHLLENNAGQAQLALKGSRQSLRRLKSLVPPTERETVAEIQEQLETVITAIEEQPFTAVQELEILWQLLQAFSDKDT
jgi:chromosome segregation ATPase